MLRFLLKKALLALLAIFCIATITFFLMHNIPGSPFLEDRILPEEVLAALNKHYGLDKPLFEQYLSYLKHLLCFDLGPSLQYEGRHVQSIIAQNFPISCLLGFEALFFAIGIGGVLGSLGAYFQGKFPDRLVLFYAILALSVPSFVTATFLQYLFGIKLGILPIARWGSFAHSLLPSLSLAAFPSAYITRLLRVSMIETLNQDYILCAKSKGLSPLRIVLTHVLPNSVLPVLSYLGPLTATVLTGSFAVEKVFGIPGLGGWFVSSITSRDYTMIMGLTLFYSIFVIFFAYLVDIAYALFNPRIRYG